MATMIATPAPMPNVTLILELVGTSAECLPTRRENQSRRKQKSSSSSSSSNNPGRMTATDFPLGEIQTTGSCPRTLKLNFNHTRDNNVFFFLKKAVGDDRFNTLLKDREEGEEGLSR